MNISDLELIIENTSGSYKKFADNLDDYPILGVTYPTHYGYIKGYFSEDGHDLDVFIGNGNIYGMMKVERDDVPGGIETKFFLGINKEELKHIKEQFSAVINDLETFNLDRFLKELSNFTGK